MSSFAEAVRVRDRDKLPVTVSVEFFLKPTPERRGIELRRLEDLSDQLSHVPPALTLHAAGAEPWLHSTAFQSLEGVLAGSDAGSGRVFFQEWLDEDDEYDRRVWLVSDAALS